MGRGDKTTDYCSAHSLAVAADIHLALCCNSGCRASEVCAVRNPALTVAAYEMIMRALRRPLPCRVQSQTAEEG